MLLSTLDKGIYAALFFYPFSLSSITGHQIVCIGNSWNREGFIYQALPFFLIRSLPFVMWLGDYTAIEEVRFADEDVSFFTQCIQEKEFYLLNPDNNFCGLKPGTISSSL